MCHEGGNLKPGMSILYVAARLGFRDDGLNAFGKAMANNVRSIASDKLRHRVARVFKEVYCYLHCRMVLLNRLRGIDYQLTMRLTLRHP